MNPETIIVELRGINAWRRGEDGVNPPEPAHFGEVLDAAAESLRSLIASNATLRRERGEARAEVAQLKGALALGQENCDTEYEELRRERDIARDGLRDSHIHAEQLESRVKELEALADAKYAQGYSAANRLNTKRREVDQAAYDELVALRAANAELQKQEAESRRLFYAEQDKRQSAEFRCEELAVTLRRIAAQKPEKPDYWTRCGQCDSNIEDAKEALARPAAGEPAKHPDTERLDWLEGDPQTRLAEVRRLIFTDRDTARESIDAARKEVQP